MHLVMIISALSLAWLLRCSYGQTGNWFQRWQQALFCFLLPPLLLLMTALAVLCMGPQGKMIGLHTEYFSYCLVLASLVISILFGLKLAAEAWKCRQQVNNYPRINLKGKTAHLLNSPLLYTAQIGFWQPSLVISQGLLETLNTEQLQAVLTHEQAHYYYRDTFWFFWLGWVRRVTTWLPNTELLWQELLLLREIRADRWAANRVDALLLAESLLIVVRAPMIASDFAAAFSCAAPPSRLQERIEALLSKPDDPTASNYWSWSWVLVGLLPLIAVPFHN
ncbi:MAG: M56 family metallopeptidase [Coleofasciculaceae cyanobacterium]